MQASSPSSSQIHRFFFFFVAFKAQAELTGVSSRFSIDCCSVNHSVTMSTRVSVCVCGSVSRLVGCCLFSFLMACHAAASPPPPPLSQLNTAAAAAAAVSSLCVLFVHRIILESKLFPVGYQRGALQLKFKEINPALAICLHSSSGGRRG